MPTGFSLVTPGEFISVCRADDDDIDTADRYIIQPNCCQEAMVSYSENVEQK